MQNTNFLAIISVILVSLISLIGIFTLAINLEKLKNILIYMISLSAGALIGDAFIHLLPEAVGESGFDLKLSLYVISGILSAFAIEKFILWRHCHMPTTKTHVHPFAWMNLFGDAIHNLIDGLVIGASYLVSIPTGIATTMAVILHEIPQEIGDFGVLLHGGFSKQKAILLNVLTAITAIAGTIIILLIGPIAESSVVFLIPFAAGSFIYIASTDLIPELHKETCPQKAFFQLFWFLVGILAMILLIALE